MSRVIRWVANAAATLILSLLATGPPAAAQQPPTPPFAPAWGMLAGWDVFAKKGCGQCHALRGFGPLIGPDLGRIKTGTSFFEIGAALWNHVPRMGEQMRAERIDRPALTAREAADLIAFLFTAQYSDETGDANTGGRVFASKGCVRCHSVGGAGGAVGPALDGLKRANSPVLVAAAMWNHGPQMAAAMKKAGIARPTFQGKEMLDVIAYVVSAARDTEGDTAQVIPGTPERGQKIFVERHCAGCHTVAGQGGKVGPDLGRPGHHVSLTQFAALLWNHGPPMWAEMKKRGLEVPTLGGQDMADVLAYLYTTHYFELRGSAQQGRQLVGVKGCTKCHSIRGTGGTAAADFARSSVVGSPASLIAGMWNHAALMEAKAQQLQVAWPTLSGSELADISAYLGSLASRRGGRPASR